VRRRTGLIGLAAVAAAGGVAIAQSADEGRIGPDNRVQPSGRQLTPAGKLTKLGNHPGGGTLTPDGRFLWALSSGRGLNDIRIVRVDPGPNCRGGARYAKCKRKRSARIGKPVQTIPMPGATGGIAMAPDGRTAYVSGSQESTHDDQQTPKDTPGKQGDVIHVFKVDTAKGTATRDGVIEVPPPGDAPMVQNFPPGTERRSWPRDLAVSPNGKTLLAALNLADYAAVIDTGKRSVQYVRTGSYPYGAAVTRDGKYGLVSNEAAGTVSVIDLASASKVKDIQVGPNLSHPEAIAADPKADRAYVAVTHQDLVAVIDTSKLEVQRTLSVERPEGIGTAPTDVSVTSDGSRLLVANSGEDAVAVFALPGGAGTRKVGAAAERADRILQHEGRRGVELSENEAEERAELLGEEAEERAEEAKAERPAVRKAAAYDLIGRIPVGSYPVMAEASPKAKRQRLVWVAAKGLGVGPNPRGPNPLSPQNSDDAINTFQYLPSIVTGVSGILSFPSDKRIKKYTPLASRQIRPVNDQKPPAGTPIATGAGKIEHVFYVVRENRTYDQILGDDARGDGDPKLSLFPAKVTPNAHALAKRFPLLDHVYANSEASIDGHFWTSAGAVSDYVTKNWHQNYGGRGRPYDFGVYAVTWPAARFLFDQAEKQGISWFNFGEAVAGVVPYFPDKDRGSAESDEIARKVPKTDIGAPTPGCFPNDASSGGIDEVLSLGPGPDTEVYDSSVPAGAPPGSLSRFDCFRNRFNTMLAQGTVPKFTYVTFTHDHTAGTRPGRRTPNAMVAENDYALGQFVDLISHSSIWDKSLILVIEDDSQDGADHVDAHRIPAFAISPYAKKGAVIHTRYDFLSFIRTLEIVTGMKPLNLFDATAVPLYDAFTTGADNGGAYDAIVPEQNLTERNPAAAANARLSERIDVGRTDRTPQPILDRILWQYVHGRESEPPPPGPNASGLDLERWRGQGLAEADDDD
jgi:DNA-binding beta-propeller fold protein YncE